MKMLSHSFKSLPKYIGSGGRLIVETSEGFTLNKYLDHTFKKRVFKIFNVCLYSFINEIKILR